MNWPEAGQCTRRERGCSLQSGTCVWRCSKATEASKVGVRLAAGVIMVMCEEAATLLPTVACGGDGVWFCPLALCSSAYSARSWQRGGFGCCWGKQRDRRDQRAPAWGRQASNSPGLAQPLGSLRDCNWCTSILALTDTFCLASVARLQKREWVMNST